jgi:hypothetical protein
MKVYNEVGFNWGWGWRSYELEYDNKEVRYKGWYKGEVDRMYIRIWIGRGVMIWSKEGVRFVKKDKYNVKVLIGFEMG